MWCCWISSDHNPATTQRSPRSEYRAARVFRIEAQVSIRLMASMRQSVRSHRAMWFQLDVRGTIFSIT